MSRSPHSLHRSPQWPESTDATPSSTAPSSPAASPSPLALPSAPGAPAARTALGRTGVGRGPRGERTGDQRGSVLIFVVGVLLLLAILATAFLGSTRADRTATQQNAFNTQVDLLIDGIVNAAKGRIASDESVPGGTTGEPFDAYTFASKTDTPTNDDWLAARVPTTADINSVFANDAVNSLPPVSNNPAWWLAITDPVLGSTFDSPYRAVGNTNPSTYTVRNLDFPQAIPTFTPPINGRRWPAFKINFAGFGVPADYRTFMAADADGDGVADSGLFKIPVGELAGLTYYGAVRIIDNNAAVNVNTALSRDYDFGGNGYGLPISASPLAGAFTSNVGLAEMLRSTLLAPNATSLPDPPPTPQTATNVYFDNMSDTSAGAYGAGFPEFTTFFQYRTNIPDDATHKPRPSGVSGLPVTATDLAPYDDTVTTAPGGIQGRRDDFQFVSIGDMLHNQIGDRVENPGVTRYTGTAAAPPTVAGKSTFVESLSLAGRFTIGTAGDYDFNRTATSNLSLTTALSPSLEYGPGASLTSTPIRTVPYTGQNGGAGIDSWFGSHFNYLFEQPDKSLTFMNRRTILTGANGVTDQTAVGPLPPDYLFSALSPQSGQWSGTGLATSTGTGTTAPLVLRNVNVYEPYTINVGPPVVPMTVISQAVGTTSLTEPKISINTGRFEELFYGFFKTMAQTGFDGFADDQGTPFSQFYNGNVNSRTAAASTETAVNARGGIAFAPAAQQWSKLDYYYNDPYVGSRFTAITFAPYTEQATRRSVVNGQTTSAEQHPLRMFRSSLRAAHDRSATYDPTMPTVSPSGYWNFDTPRLPADQMLVLRAALAAANAEALRDSSNNINPATPANGGYNDRIVPHQVPLTAMVGGAPTAVVAHVYGLRRQPYITEVYAVASAGADTTALPANPNGYVAIKLYNPYSVPISLRYCRLVGLRRLRDTTVTTVPAIVPVSNTQYPNMRVFDLATPLAGAATATTDQLDLGTATSNLAAGNPYSASPYVIPPNGTLVLENYNQTVPGTPPVQADEALHRPASISGTGTNALPNNGAITPANPANMNFAFVRGLQRVVWDRELVLMRPMGCTPPDAAATPVNMLEYIDEQTTVPPNSVARMVPLDSYDFTGLNFPGNPSPPARTRAEAWYYRRNINTTTPWKWVYPGRYDGDQAIVTPPTSTINPRPRQQGTIQHVSPDGLGVGWDPANAEDPFAGGTTPIPGGPQFNIDPAVAGGAVATYPDMLTIQLNAPGWPGDNPLHDYTTAGASPNVFPFGGFRRLGDLLQVPFIGSYTIQTEADAVAVATRFLEVNPVTMDAAFAEDTDPGDNENAYASVDTAIQSREQVGRFIPLRPTVGGTVGFTNGRPAYETRDPAATGTTPGTYSADYDLAFDEVNSAANVLDPMRYRDDKVDAVGRALPTTGNPNPDNINVRVNRYQWANNLFDNFAITSPHDDSVPNYPTQPKWRPNTLYSIGDTVQLGQDVFICIVNHLSGADPITAVEMTGGIPADSTNGYKITPPPAPPANPNWRPLIRNPLTNASARAGSRSDRSGTRSDAYYATNDSNEVSQSTPGLININTAPEKVLAALPWCPRTGYGAAGRDDVLTVTFNNYPSSVPPFVTFGGDGIDDNAQIAHMIVLYRDGDYTLVPSPVNNLNFATNIAAQVARAPKPFTSLWDLYKVPGFRLAQNAILTLNPATYPRQSIGDYSPPYDAASPARTDNVPYDFEKQTLLLNHVSNLITTRSDFFTIYALVQGWRNVGTANPQLVVQRRAAFIVDRSGTTATSQTLSSSRVPVN